MAAPIMLALTAPAAAAAAAAAASRNEICSALRRRVCLTTSQNMSAVCILTSQFLGLHLRMHSCIVEGSMLITPLLMGPRRPLVVARLFGPVGFEASKLKVLFLGEGKDTRPDELPRAYTLTHNDITSKLTLSISESINKAQIQGWYNMLQRDEVLAEWKKLQGSMSLHVHCHISGCHWLLDTIANLRFHIFRKELPVVLEAFKYGDENLFKNHPELEEALVWVYFHSNVKEFNRVECWGPLREATKGACSLVVAKEDNHKAMEQIDDSRLKQLSNTSRWKIPVSCPCPCECCFPPSSSIPLPPSFKDLEKPEELYRTHVYN